MCVFNFCKIFHVSVYHIFHIAYYRGKGYGGTAKFWISAKHQRKAEECWGCRPCFPSIWKKGLIDNIKAQVRRIPGGPGGLEGQGGFPNNFWLLKEDHKKRIQGEPLASLTIFCPNWRNKIFFLILAPPFFFTFRHPPWLNYRYVNCIEVLRQTNKNKQRNKSGTSLYTVLRCLHLQCLRNLKKNVKNQYFYDICVKCLSIIDMLI